MQLNIKPRIGADLLGSPLQVFNVCGNNYRLICAIHYDTGKVFLLRFLTHAEYDKDRWKTEL